MLSVLPRSYVRGNPTGSYSPAMPRRWGLNPVCACRRIGVEDPGRCRRPRCARQSRLLHSPSNDLGLFRRYFALAEWRARGRRTPPFAQGGTVVLVAVNSCGQSCPGTREARSISAHRLRRPCNASMENRVSCDAHPICVASGREPALHGLRSLTDLITPRRRGRIGSGCMTPSWGLLPERAGVAAFPSLRRQRHESGWATMTRSTVAIFA